MSAPLLSVVTVVRNGERDIARTLQSLVDCKRPGVELIVIDGASSDRTLEIARGFLPRLDVLVSEADQGIYDAMNKGIARATGRFVLHVNAGDRLLRAPLEALAQADDGIDALGFPVRLSDGRVFRPGTGLRMRVFNTLHHQGTCYRRVPGFQYDTRWRTFADFDLNQRLVASGRAQALGGEPIAEHALDGVSNDRRRAGELFAVIRANHGAAWVAASWASFKIRGLLWRMKSLFRS